MPERSSLRFILKSGLAHSCLIICSSLQISRIIFVDTPGAERLAVDPDILCLREGHQLNKGILAIGSIIRELASRTDGGSHTPNYDDSILTQILSG